VRAPHGLNQQAGVRLPGHDGRTGGAALQQMLARIELESAELGVGVAGEAVLAQDRPHALFEKLRRLLSCHQASQ